MSSDQTVQRNDMHQLDMPRFWTLAPARFPSLGGPASCFTTLAMQNKYWIARNTQTGLYYSMSMACGFVGTKPQATLLDSVQAALVRATYLNVQLEAVS